MSRAAKLTPDQMLADDMASFYADPLGFVMYAFPWDSDRSIQMCKLVEPWKSRYPNCEYGPDEWACKFLDDLGASIKERGFDGSHAVDPIQMAVSSGHGTGKAMPLDLEVPTPFGVVRWGDLEPGMFLFGADGSPTRILETKRYNSAPLYRVTFDDRSSTIVSSGHLWNVRGRQDRRKGLAGWNTLTTQQILDMGVKRPNGVSSARQWEIPVQGCPVYAWKDLPVDPYTYGVWLGDGDKRSGRITNIDKEVWENIAYETRVSGMVRTALGLKVDLEKAGLFGCTTYTAAVDRRYIEHPDRLHVLQGLLDTDGWVEKSGAAAFASASRQLTRDVVELARSLGLKVREEKYKPNEHAGSWHTNITWDGKTKLFRIARKQKALIAAEERYTKRWIDSIEPVGDGACMCVTVEAEDGLYLANDFIVTHNSAMTGWLTCFIMSTRPFSQGTVTANTGPQLETKTWPQIVKWMKMCVTSHWFDITSGRGSMKMTHKRYPEKWYVSAQTCREENSESFAGQHAASSTSFYINDESSAIPDKIFEVQDGGLTDGEPMRFAFGNPTRNTGRFREIWGKYRDRWVKYKIDSRDCQITNKRYLESLIKDEGIDSDYVKVRVLGEFPSSGDMQFIAQNVVEAAIERGRQATPTDINMEEALIVGIDFSRQGGDKSVIRATRGRHAYKPHKFRERDSMKAAAIVANILGQAERLWGSAPDAVFGDGGGIGGPIIDRLNQLGHNVIEIQFGAKCPEPQKYANMRTYMWARMRDWLETACIDDDDDLKTDLIGPEYHHHGRTDAIALESKDDMRKRGLDSPDDGDALAMTRAMPVAPKAVKRINSERRKSNKTYNPLKDRLRAR